MELKSTYGIDLMHDTRHLFKRFRIDGIKAMLGGISGGSQNITLAYSVIAVDFISVWICKEVPSGLFSNILI